MTIAYILIVLFVCFIMYGIIFSLNRILCLKFSSRRPWRLVQQKARCDDSGAATSSPQWHISFFSTAAGMYLSLLTSCRDALLRTIKDICS